MTTIYDVSTSGRKGDWYQTHSGIAFWPLDPRPEEIAIEDIAHHLSMVCRFGGAVREFYSVAEHSVRVMREIQRVGGTKRTQRWGLLHDAAEAYIGDMVRPVKYHMPKYREVEEALMATICDKFELPIDQPDIVTWFDGVLLLTERRDLLKEPPIPWKERDYEPLEDRIEPLPPRAACELFLLEWERVKP